MNDQLVLHPTSTSQWHALVSEASHESHIMLPEELESYLVFLLMRFTDSPSIAHSIVCLEFLKSAHQEKRLQQQSLREVGDCCLLYAGLFPGQARKRRVRISYYIKVGKSAYLTLAEPSPVSPSPSWAELYAALHDQFVPLMDVLQTMRELHANTPSLDPLQAEEIWSDTGSLHALETLRKFAHNPSMILSSPSHSDPKTEH